LESKHVINKKADLGERLYDFALRIIKLVRSLPKEMAALEVGRQLLHSGTSIAANYEEAAAAFSKEDFTYKLSIAFKESKEANLWLRLLRDSRLVQSQEVEHLIQESAEIKNILVPYQQTNYNASPLFC